MGRGRVCCLRLRHFPLLHKGFFTNHVETPQQASPDGGASDGGLRNLEQNLRREQFENAPRDQIYGC